MSSTSEGAALQQRQELAMYRCTSDKLYKCTSDTSLDIFSPAKTSGQMAKEDSVRFQITNQSENVSKAPSEKVTYDDNPSRSIEALSENEDLGFFGRIRQIVESFNMEDFWHALFLGKYLGLHVMTSMLLLKSEE